MMTPVAVIKGKPAIVAAWHRWGTTRVQVYVNGRLKAEVRFPTTAELQAAQAQTTPPSAGNAGKE